MSGNHWRKIHDQRFDRPDGAVVKYDESTMCDTARSACKFCPFHSDEEWLRLRAEEPEEFEAAAKYESELQAAARGVIKGVPFLHDSLRPLKDVKFDTGPSHAQLSLFNNECEGMCGV